MKISKYVIGVAVVGMCASSAAYAQFTFGTTSNTSTSTTTTTAPAPAPAPVVTSVTATMGEGDEHANANGKEAIEQHMSIQGTISGHTLNVTAISNGHLTVGQKLSGSGLPAGTTIKAFGSGHGGVGTYTVGFDSDN
jgi:hypothetical protein